MPDVHAASQSSAVSVDVREEYDPARPHDYEKLYILRKKQRKIDQQLRRMQDEERRERRERERESRASHAQHPAGRGRWIVDLYHRVVVFLTCDHCGWAWHCRRRRRRSDSSSSSSSRRRRRRRRAPRLLLLCRWREWHGRPDRAHCRRPGPRARHHAAIVDDPVQGGEQRERCSWFAFPLGNPQPRHCLCVGSVVGELNWRALSFSLCLYSFRLSFWLTG
eukprot:COSAG01_NODE_4098_length_5351_cov_628.027984_4_plen_221_part_00